MDLLWLSGKCVFDEDGDEDEIVDGLEISKHVTWRKVMNLYVERCSVAVTYTIL